MREAAIVADILLKLCNGRVLYYKRLKSYNCYGKIK